MSSSQLKIKFAPLLPQEDQQDLSKKGAEIDFVVGLSIPLTRSHSQRVASEPPKDFPGASYSGPSLLLPSSLLPDKSTSPFQMSPFVHNPGQVEKTERPKPPLVTLALRFAAATYEKKDGTDEQQVFDILAEVTGYGAEAKKEFQEILVAMAKTNRDGSTSYYEKVSASASLKDGFVAAVLAYEMKGWLIQAEYKEAMAIWMKAQPKAPPTRRSELLHMLRALNEFRDSTFFRQPALFKFDLNLEKDSEVYNRIDSNHHPYHSNFYEQFAEGFLNSIAEMGDAALEHPILTGFCVAMGAGAILSGAAPIVATGVEGMKLLSALPYVIKGLQYFGNISAGVFTLKGGYHQLRALSENNEYLQGRQLRKMGESLGTAFFSLSWGQGAQQVSGAKAFRSSTQAADAALGEMELAAGLEKLNALKQASERKKFLEGWVYSEFSDFRLKIMNALSDTDLLLLDPHLVLEVYFKGLKSGDPEMLEMAVGIYQKIHTQLSVGERLTYLHHLIGLDPVQRASLLEKLPKENEEVLIAFKMLLQGMDAALSEHDKFVGLMNWLEAVKESKFMGIQDTAVMAPLESWLLRSSFSQEVKLSSEEIVRLIDLLFSEGFRQENFLSLWAKLLPILNVEHVESLEVALALYLLEDPGNQAYQRLQDSIQLYKSLKQAGPSEVIHLQIGSEQGPYRFDYKPDPTKGFHGVLMQASDGAHVHFRGEAGNSRIQWDVDGRRYGDGSHLLSIRAKDQAPHSFYAIHSSDAQKIEEAIMGLLSLTENTGDISRIPWYRRKNPLPELKSEKDEILLRWF